MEPSARPAAYARFPKARASLGGYALHGDPLVEELGVKEAQQQVRAARGRPRPAVRRRCRQLARHQRLLLALGWVYQRQRGQVHHGHCDESHPPSRTSLRALLTRHASPPRALHLWVLALCQRDCCAQPRDRTPEQRTTTALLSIFRRRPPRRDVDAADIVKTNEHSAGGSHCGHPLRSATSPLCFTHRRCRNAQPQRRRDRGSDNRSGVQRCGELYMRLDTRIRV
jgi:hypothetical protein